MLVPLFNHNLLPSQSPCSRILRCNCFPATQAPLQPEDVRACWRFFNICNTYYVCSLKGLLSNLHISYVVKPLEGVIFRHLLLESHLYIVSVSFFAFSLPQQQSHLWTSRKTSNSVAPLSHLFLTWKGLWIQSD